MLVVVVVYQQKVEEVDDALGLKVLLWPKRRDEEMFSC